MASGNHMIDQGPEYDPPLSRRERAERAYNEEIARQERAADAWDNRCAMAAEARAERLTAADDERQRDPRSDLERIADELQELHDWNGGGALEGAIKLVRSAAKKERKDASALAQAKDWTRLCLPPRS